MVDLAEEVRALKVERHAAILAHNYQLPEIQDVADVVADSLKLARQASELDASVLVICGVHFMPRRRRSRIRRSAFSFPISGQVARSPTRFRRATCGRGARAIRMGWSLRT
jgi:hypothetical protein